MVSRAFLLAVAVTLAVAAVPVLAQDYAARAKGCINGQRDSEYARALLTLPDFILEREN